RPQLVWQAQGFAGYSVIFLLGVYHETQGCTINQAIPCLHGHKPGRLLALNPPLWESRAGNKYMPK
ncbi:MAG: hypothetical protein ACM3H7_05885, partial [Acidobacteriaceae bacterium]